MAQRALIIGAGIGGLTAAIALRKIGYSVQIFERAPEVRALGTGLCLWSNAMWALSVLPLWVTRRCSVWDSASDR